MKHWVTWWQQFHSSYKHKKDENTCSHTHSHLNVHRNLKLKQHKTSKQIHKMWCSHAMEYNIRNGLLIYGLLTTKYHVLYSSIHSKGPKEFTTFRGRLLVLPRVGKLEEWGVKEMDMVFLLKWWKCSKFQDSNSHTTYSHTTKNILKENHWILCF